MDANPVNIYKYEALAKSKLGQGEYDFIAGGAATGPLWFQSYFFKDRHLTLEMAHRAEAVGYAALCLTLDAKVKPKRERNIRICAV